MGLYINIYHTCLLILQKYLKLRRAYIYTLIGECLHQLFSQGDILWLVMTALPLLPSMAGGCTILYFWESHLCLFRLIVAPVGRNSTRYTIIRLFFPLPPKLSFYYLTLIFVSLCVRMFVTQWRHNYSIDWAEIYFGLTYRYFLPLKYSNILRNSEKPN